MRLQRALEAALTVGDTERAIAEAEKSGSLEGRVVAKGVRAVARGADAVEEVVAAELVTARVEYDRFLPFLGTLGNNAPFISEALVATAVGLLVAIPAVIAYNQFKGLINARIGHTDALTHTLLAHLKERER